ncbi:hypothetical protein [Stenotrophomonas sp. YIM B06876]|uniref:hypothetical protein n=1 Tax=Stenotrophomonas sp. YIM B06876 TaxID=3060211 RepID=UPI0027382796|nr:hypothetical protein [Stenotrophomonas sp. YIM B06876]
MSKFTVITDRALERAMELASTAGDSLRHGSVSTADWVKTGAALGAIRTGGKVATKLVRRNPAISIVAAAVGVGLLGYAIYRKRQRSQGVTLEGRSQRIAAKRRHTANVVDETSDIGSDA